MSRRIPDPESSRTLFDAAEVMVKMHSGPLYGFTQHHDSLVPTGPRGRSEG